VILDDADDVALRVLQPGDGDLGFCDVRRRHDDGRPQLLGAVEVGLWIVYLDVDHDGRTVGGVSGAPVPSAITALVRDGKKVAAIRGYRHDFDASLADATRAVGRLAD